MAPSAIVYLGTQRAGPDTGLSLATFDEDTGRLSEPELAAVADDPAFPVVHPDGRHLYVSNSGAPGGLSAYAIDPPTGALTFLNRTVSAGRGPSQVSLDGTGRFVLAAYYHGGYVETVAIDDLGRLGPATARIEHRGHGTNPERQTRPYPHCIRVDPSNRFALAADLGLDQVLVYRFDAGRGTLAPHDPPGAAVPPGSGARHLAWHPDGARVYVVDEISSGLTTLDWDGASGVLTPRGTVSVLPAGYHGANTSAEIVVHPSGRTLYVSNRGHDSVAVCDVAAADGAPTVVDIVAAHGRMPRYMTLDPSGRWLIVTNHDSDNVTVFAVDADTGRLRFHATIPATRPYGIAIVPAA